jgi:Tfp pilus assembly protein PilF
MYSMKRMSAGAWMVLAAMASCVSAGCNESQPAEQPQGSDAAQSVAEYDLAVDLWLGRHQPRQALEKALHAVKLDDDNAAANHLVALLYLDFCQRDAKECRFDEAERYARAALEADEQFREAKNTLGVILIHEKRYPEAIDVLRPLSQDMLYQTPENAWGNLGWAYLESGLVDEAIDALQRSTAVQPAFCVGHYRLGVAYEKKKDPRAAIAAYTRALAVDNPRCKQLQEAFAARGRLQIQLGRQDDGISDLEQCVHLANSTQTGRECAALLSSLK